MTDNGSMSYAEWIDAMGLTPPDLVLRNAAGEPLDAEFNVDEQIKYELMPGGKPFGRLARLKHDEPRSWVSPNVSFAMLLHLEAETERARDQS
jgi:hypothetical protein